MTSELKQCMFCTSTDGAYNEVCNYHYAMLQHEPIFNDYLDKFEEMDKAKHKLLERFAS